MTTTCGFAPFPGNGAYGHWRCQRNRYHLGRHRFQNYTVPRMPRVWQLQRLWGAARTNRRMRGHLKAGYSYRRALYPTRYDPTDYSEADR
jgi:hypothetical protein